LYCHKGPAESGNESKPEKLGVTGRGGGCALMWDRLAREEKSDRSTSGGPTTPDPHERVKKNGRGMMGWKTGGKPYRSNNRGGERGKVYTQESLRKIVQSGTRGSTRKARVNMLRAEIQDMRSSNTREKLATPSWEAKDIIPWIV